MAYIVIPTGMKTVTATVSRKSFIQYRCQKCGKNVLYEYVLKQQSSGSYHVLQSAQAKKQVETEAGSKAVQIIDKQDEELFSAINIEHEYGKIGKKIKCPHCGEVQSWSKIPCEWKKSKLFRLWVLILIFMSIMTLLMISFTIDIPIATLIMCIPVVLVALIPLFRNIRRKKALSMIQNSNFVPPVYYNQQNINELIGQERSDTANNS